MIINLIIVEIEINITQKLFLSSVDRRARKAMKNGEKIKAIKMLRQHHGWLLKDCREYVESKWQDLYDSYYSSPNFDF